MNSAIKDSVFPGAVLSFGNEEGVLFHEAFGHFTYDSGSAPVSTGSLFDLASVSKVVGTTSAAMLLVNNKEMNIDQRVIDYLPEFNNNGKDQITIRNLLLHNFIGSIFKTYTYTSIKLILRSITIYISVQDQRICHTRCNSKIVAYRDAHISRENHIRPS